ncbi:MAG: hypothetical protein JOZ39_13050 [Chloroflexi bacterium]|nr:hypothetical protein [Chloroflexota bacterium]
MNQFEEPAVERALGYLAPPVMPDVEAALNRQLAMQQRRDSSASPLWNRLAVLRRPVPAIPIAAALVAALSLFTTPVQGLAAQVLPMFRTQVQDVTPISIDHLNEPMPDLAKLGDLNAPSKRGLQPVQVASASAAGAQVGFTVLTPSQLPAGLGAQPVVAVTQGESVDFTFRAQKAQAYLDSIGRKDISLPAKFDGASLHLQVNPAATLAYLPAGTSLATLGQGTSSSSPSSKPDPAAVSKLLNGSGVMLIETKAPTLETTGVSPDDLRSFLLTMPLPDQTKQQLSAISDWSHTLPIPAGSGSQLHKLTINGAPGVAGKNGSAETAVWVKSGVLYGITAQKVDEAGVLALANSMK